MHAKLVIVDDRFVTIGSTNVGLRSHTTDTELNMSMVDTATIDGLMGGSPVKVGKFAKELRLQLWNEHLAVPVAELDDPIAARVRWPVQKPGSKKIHHACYHAGTLETTSIKSTDWYRAVKALLQLMGDVGSWPAVSAAEKTLVETADKLLEALGAGGPNGNISDLLLGPLWVSLRPQLKYLLKTRIMNVETRCNSI